MKWAKNVCRIVWVVKWRRLHVSLAQETKKPCHMLPKVKWGCNVQMDGGDTNSKQHLHDSGVYKKKVYNIVKKVKWRTVWCRYGEEMNVYILLLWWNEGFYAINNWRRQMCAVMCQKQNEGLYDADKVEKTSVGSFVTKVKWSRLWYVKCRRQ